MITKFQHRRFFKSTRHNMYKSIIKSIPENFSPEFVLCVSGDLPLSELFPSAKLDKVDYPEYDVCDLYQIADNTYDAIICDQVLEHVENPFRAVDEMYRVLKPCGTMILTTVFMYPIHEYPKDYWRFTPDGLRKLCEKFSIQICDGWGNQDMVKLVADNRERHKGVPSVQNIPYSLLSKNNPETPLTTWIIAQK